MRALLLVDIIIVVMAVPISAWQKRICGEQLVETVTIVCSTRGFYSHGVAKRDAELFQDERAAKSFLGSRVGSRQRRRTGRIATECCENVCNFEVVESYCNPWPVVEDRDDPKLAPVAPGQVSNPWPVVEDRDDPMLAPVAAGKVRTDKSADTDELYQDPVSPEEVNSVIRREEALIEALETMDGEHIDGDVVILEPNEAGEGEVEQETEKEDDAEEEEEVEEEELPFPVPVPTKKRRRMEGRKSRENTRDRSGKSEGRSRKKSGSREGGRSSRRRGKSSRSRKGKDGRERNKRWEGLVTSNVPSVNIVDALRNALRAVTAAPFIKPSGYKVYEKRDTKTYKQHRLPKDYSLERDNESQFTQPGSDSTLAALYHLAVRLATARRD